MFGRMLVKDVLKKLVGERERKCTYIVIRRFED